MPIFSPPSPEVFRRIPAFAGLALGAALAAGAARAETGVDMLLGEWDWEGKQTAALDAWAGKSTATQDVDWVRSMGGRSVRLGRWPDADVPKHGQKRD